MNPPPDAEVVLTITTKRGTITAWVEDLDHPRPGMTARARFEPESMFWGFTSGADRASFTLEKGADSVSHTWLRHGKPWTARFSTMQQPDLTVDEIADLRRAASAALAMIGVRS